MGCVCVLSVELSQNISSWKSQLGLHKCIPLLENEVLVVETIMQLYIKYVDKVSYTYTVILAH